MLPPCLRLSLTLLLISRVLPTPCRARSSSSLNNWALSSPSSLHATQPQGAPAVWRPQASHQSVFQSLSGLAHVPLITNLFPFVEVYVHWGRHSQPAEHQDFWQSPPSSWCTAILL